MEIKSFINKFNPSTKEFGDALSQYKNLDLASRVSIAALTALTALATFFILGLGAVPVFKYLVNWVHTKQGRSTEEDQIPLRENQGFRHEFRPFEEICQRRVEDQNPLRENQGLRHQVRTFEEISQRCEEAIRGISDGIEQHNLDPIRNFNLPEGRVWVREDLSNGSELNQLFDLLSAPPWYNNNIQSEQFTVYFPADQNGVIDFLSTSHLDQLIAYSTYIVSGEAIWNDEDDEGYDELSEIRLTFVGLANSGALTAWLNRAHTLLAEF